MTATAGHVFVSHSSDNRELANELAAFIEARGVKVWIAPRDVRPGKDYSEQLQLAIEGCAAFVVLVTEMANKSPYVRAETEMAFSTHKPIFPIRISDIQPAAGLALFLKIRHWTDAFGPGKSESLARLAQELQALAPAAAPAEQAAFAAASPPAPQAPPAAAAASVPPAAPPLPTTPEGEVKWRAAVGPNADWYLQRWRAMEAKASALSWNWPACLLNLFWFAYRKMWVPLAPLVVALLVIGALGAGSPAAGRVSMILSIGMSFVTGAFGNHLYRKQTATLVAQGGSLDQLRARGGVSKAAAIISVAIVGILALLAIVGAVMALQQQKAQLEGPNQLNVNTGNYPPATDQWQDPDAQTTDPVASDYEQDPAYEGAEGDKPIE
jgi:hypothetical protein